jgi:hypothetical protein
VIANPPYVRTQILGAEKSQELAAAFGLNGRVDLYHAFLIAMTHSLVPGGILGVITSNRFLSTRGGISVRDFMSREYDIVEVFDLGDTKLFEAAVLPAVFIGRRRSDSRNNHPFSNQAARFVRIYEDLNRSARVTEDLRQADSIYAVLENEQDGNYCVSGRRFKVATGHLSLPLSSAEPWSMVTSAERAWLAAVNSRANFRICDILNVRVGIKTTADAVFIRTDWQDLPENLRPEKRLLHCLLSHDDADRWVSQSKRELLRQVLYTHEIKGGRRVVIDLAEYPKASAYLETHRKRLESRAYVLKAKRQWYEIWVPQNPTAWKQPKIVFPDISPEPKFFYDGQGCIVDGNCYWIILNANQDPDMLFLILGVANSNLMIRYHDLTFNNRLYSGRRRYLSQYVEKYPMPDPRARPSKDIVSLVKALVFSSPTAELRGQIERDLEIAVAQAFGVDPIFDI